jgi:V/A-type H+-transporting ATPase subunit I
VLNAVRDQDCAEPVLARETDRASLAVDVVARQAVRHGDARGVLCWVPARSLPALRAAVGPLGGATVAVPVPRGETPPTQLTPEGATGAFQPLVDTYTTVPYRDIDPSAAAGLAYVAMFGMMFADTGHGLLLLAAGLLLRSRPPHRLTPVRWAAPFVIGAGATSAALGVVFGEAFGPTGLVPTLWMSPLDDPLALLLVAIAVGGAFLMGSYALGAVNRWREGGPREAVFAVTGLAGAMMFTGLAALGGGIYTGRTWAVWVGAVVAAAGFTTAFVGMYAVSRSVLASVAEMFDATLRLFTNTVSFARLAAFGLTHAALGALVWDATTGAWSRGGLWLLAAVLVFVLGNAVTFTLEAVVAAVQALRLEYYELFSRVFSLTGRPFRPWSAGQSPQKQPQEVS